MVLTRSTTLYFSKIDSALPIKMAIPSPTIHYCILNGSAKVFSKLLQSCRHLFTKYGEYRITPIRFCNYNYENKCWKASITETDDYNSKKICVEKSPFKYWLNGRLCIQTEERKRLAEILVPKIYRNQITSLSLRYQIMTFVEFKILTSSEFLENFYATLTTVKYEQLHRHLVPFKLILECLQNAKCICANKSFDFPPETAKDMIKILPNFQNLESLSLYRNNGKFDFVSFSDFIKETPKIRINMLISGPFTLKYMKQLKKFVEDLNKDQPRRKARIEFNDKKEFEFNVTNQ